MSPRKPSRQTQSVPPVPAIPRVLEDRVALITGAGSGLGRGIAIGLARAGAKVALLDIDLAAAGETEALIAAAAGRTLAIQADVTSERDVAEAFQQTVRALGDLTICVPAAGIAPAFPLADFPVEPDIVASAAYWREALESLGYAAGEDGCYEKPKTAREGP